MDSTPPIGRLLSINVARMRLIVLNDQPAKTGIYKYPVEGRVELRDNQVGSDRQADYDVHGGRRGSCRQGQARLLRRTGPGR